MQRIAFFDRARGLAILLMVFANSTPVLGLNYIGPLWLKVLCSIPAPLFVIIAGMMVAKTSHTQPADYYIKRGAGLLILAAAINVFIHQSQPFQNIEILYLIGLSIPVTYIINYLKTHYIIIFCFLNFISAQILQLYFPLDLALINSYSKWQLFFINGWFPLLPWTGIMSVGIIFYRLFVQNILFSRKIIKLILIGMFILGLVLAYFYPRPLLFPWGYQELFYPPSLNFIFISIPAVWMVLYILNIFNTLNTPFFSPIELLGKNSLFIYVLHLAVIFWIIGPFFYPIQSLYYLFGLYFLHSCFLYCTCYLIQKIFYPIKITGEKH
jgi:uncharacterized membrane protein